MDAHVCPAKGAMLAWTSGARIVPWIIFDFVFLVWFYSRSVVYVMPLWARQWLSDGAGPVRCRGDGACGKAQQGRRARLHDPVTLASMPHTIVGTYGHHAHMLVH